MHDEEKGFWSRLADALDSWSPTKSYLVSGCVCFAGIGMIVLFYVAFRAVAVSPQGLHNWMLGGIALFGSAGVMFLTAAAYDVFIRPRRKKSLVQQ